MKQGSTLSEKINSLEEEAETAAQKIIKQDSVRLIGQYDADGISATSIIVKFLETRNINHSYSILKQLYEEDVERISEEEANLTVFVDVGSGQAKKISEEFNSEEVLVIDHHEPESQEGFVHVNPHFHGIDGGSEISASGTAFKVVEQAQGVDLTKYLTKALVGATGDVQKKENGFKGVNKDIMEKAVQNGVVTEKKGLDLYGRTTKPLHKSLMYTSDPYLEGITGNESGAIQFLKNSGIDVKSDDGFRSLSDLSSTEEKRLINSMLRQGYDIERIVRNVYLLDNGLSLDEFSTVVNACGRMGIPSEGVDLLLDFDQSKVDKILRRYGRKISSALNTVENHQSSELGDGKIGVLDVGGKIDDEFIGIVTGICMSDSLMSDKEVGVSFAEAEDNMIKISARASKEAVEDGIDLGEIISSVCEELSEEGGGHDAAAGAKIDPENKDEFKSKFEEAALEHL